MMLARRRGTSAAAHASDEKWRDASRCLGLASPASWRWLSPCGSTASCSAIYGARISGNIGEDATTGAPLPVLGLRWLWRLPKNFYLTAQVQYFYLEFDPYSGSLTDLKASLVWQVTNHVGIGVGYNDFGFRFDIEDQGEFNGRLRWNYGGAVAFASFMF
jgi:hypothetical protein